ncbi:MAG: hypothetical protein AB7Y46_14195 [Armatimonadota bacterium]
MPHRIIYEHISGWEDDFRTFRVVWEPYTNRVALHFRDKREAAHGLVGTVEETIRYLDKRARGGPPWDRGAPREARQRLAQLIGEIRANERGETKTQA